MSIRYASQLGLAVLALSIPLAVASPTASGAIVMSDFAEVAGSPDGEFGWAGFVLPYGGPHVAGAFAGGKLTGTGTASISVTPATGGFPPPQPLITTDMLYSGGTVPTWSLDFSGLVNKQGFTSLVVQAAISEGASADGPLAAGAFTIGGVAPTEFAILRSMDDDQAPFNYYWAEWQGLTHASSYQVQISGAASGMHTAFAGASAAYFNTSSAAYDITAVPEPSSAGVLALIGAFAGALRRRR